MAAADGGFQNGARPIVGPVVGPMAGADSQQPVHREEPAMIHPSARRACALTRTGLAIVALLGTCAAATAQSTASSVCPTYFFLSDGIGVNPDLETPTDGIPAGTMTCWSNGDPTPPPAAADRWFMHTSNSAAKVCSKLVPSTAPGHAPGSLMLRFKAGGNEGGIYQATGTPSGHSYMFSAWVKVMSGHVALQPNGGNQGPAAWSTKIGEWEQLRVCTSATGVTDSLVIYNEDPAGGVFFVDRTELREIPVQ
jgi:hypothetical protein